MLKQRGFRKYSFEELDECLKDKKKLTSVLIYHVVLGKEMVTDFKRPKTIKTIQGQEIEVDGMMCHVRKSIKVNDAKTMKPDIEATNGVIHAIDTVLMPQ